jgi:hypothetical protein
MWFVSEAVEDETIHAISRRVRRAGPEMRNVEELQLVEGQARRADEPAKALREESFPDPNALHLIDA